MSDRSIHATLPDGGRAAMEGGRAMLVHGKEEGGGADVAPPATVSPRRTPSPLTGLPPETVTERPHAAGGCRMALDLLMAIQIVVQGLRSLAARTAGGRANTRAKANAGDS